MCHRTTEYAEWVAAMEREEGDPEESLDEQSEESEEREPVPTPGDD